MPRRNPGTWGALLEWCVTEGVDSVCAKLERVHRVYQEREAALWAEGSDRSAEARKVQKVVLKQAETLARLRQMSDEDARALFDGRV